MEPEEAVLTGCAGTGPDYEARVSKRCAYMYFAFNVSMHSAESQHRMSNLQEIPCGSIRCRMSTCRALPCKIQDGSKTFAFPSSTSHP